MAQQNLLQAFAVKAWLRPQGGKEEKDICLQWAGQPLASCWYQLLLPTPPAPF